MAKILLVEDNEAFAELVEDLLTSNKHVLEVASTRQYAAELLKVYEYDMLIVDWELPDGSGADLIHSIRQSGQGTPILMLTARETLDDKEHGLGAGADDYLTKTADPRELLARVKALMRRPAIYKQEVLDLGTIQINVSQHVVTKNGQVVHLFPKELALLEYMAQHKESVLTADELLERIWPSDTEATSQTVRSCVNRIRAKLDDPDQPSLIQTLYKIGYRLNR